MTHQNGNIATCVFPAITPCIFLKFFYFPFHFSSVHSSVFDCKFIWKSYVYEICVKAANEGHNKNSSFGPDRKTPVLI